MKMQKLMQAAAFAALATSAFAQQATPDLPLGKMWTFENPPLAYLEKEYGFKPTQQWLDYLRLSALRLGERENPWCSAAFVSPQGLIMTNHHCVREKVSEIQDDNDWVKDGYAATSLENEVKIPKLTVQQLVAQENVTAAVDAGIEAGDDAVTIAKMREENIARIKKDADEKQPDRMHQVVKLYQGAVVQLYTYRVFDDIRLVLAPNLQTAYFGGDPDNFTYPRYDIDFSFLRAYEDGKPADTAANYFRWRQEGAKEGELVFIPGNPGSTNRLFTEAQLLHQRDVQYPLILGQLGNLIDIVRPFAKNNPGLESQMFSWSNSQKAIGGMLAGLKDPELMQKKHVHEQAFKAAVMADPKLAAKFGKVWDDIAALAAQKRGLDPKMHFYQPGYASVLSRAIAIAKAVDDSQSDADRKTAREEALGMRMNPLNAITGQLTVDHFQRAQQWLAKDDPFLAVTGSSPQGAEKMIQQSKLGSGKLAKDLLDGGADAVAASEDPGMQIGRVLYQLMRDTEKQAHAVDSALEVQGTLIGQALFAVYGTNVSPDATMTLRFSDGIVKGYEYNGTLAPWATCFYGLYGRSVEFGGKFPFNLPAPWAAAKDKIDMTKKMDFVSTNDIVGGNSGSSMIDKDLQVIGLVFDGNIESLPNDFYYTQTRARSVGTHTDAIVEALSKVYGMQWLLDELRAGAKVPR